MQLLPVDIQAFTEAGNFPAAFLEQGHQGGIRGGLGQHLHQETPGAAHPLTVDPLPHEHR